MIHETFGKIVCGLITQELRFLEGLSPVTANLRYKTKTHKHTHTYKERAADRKTDEREGR